MPHEHPRGGLRPALVRAARDLIAERGLDAFSVAEIARRCGVSGGAPYRHFAGHRELLAAVALSVVTELHERVSAAAARHTDPADELAAAAGAYTDYVIRTRAGLHVIYNRELRAAEHPDLHTAGRGLMDEYLALSLAVSASAEQALLLMEQLLTQAHGYATFYLDGVLAMQGYRPDQVVAKSVSAARTIIAATG
ncbi:TetR/AcrR family transcriptional regulator [Saccharopolyspora sp. HNM0983]|uniref:TetR/AcrR family transcriptional regulator n=1 Tax=Saccharopolyspora montiporae TaxID=2781240 RepID=A0A929G0Q5_9PSEU|nr:TetR/AcrR family transcriptional regulator [Saccharopolyspora sp. HNM0983]MBE9373868.1 TetR/AcrR family transcriptional regulator [Saccharopolyspora sp. HNM0983]